MSALTRPLREWETRRALRASRRAADTELLASSLPPLRLAWRAAELTSDSNRLQVAASVTNVVHASGERLLPGSSPLDRGAVRAARAVLLALAARLYDLQRPVQPRGMLLVDGLLSDRRSPLFGTGGSLLLGRAAREALAALERRQHDTDR